MSVNVIHIYCRLVTLYEVNMTQGKVVINTGLNGLRIMLSTSVFAPSAHCASPYGDYSTTYYGTNSCAVHVYSVLSCPICR